MRFYRALLYLFPKSFRAEYGGEMSHVFAERRRLASGPLAALAVYGDALRDVIVNAWRVHLDILGQDLHYTARTLARTPGFTLTAVLVTALGIGANTAAFSVTDRVFIRPLPFPESERLVKLWQRQPNYARMELSPPNYRDWRSMTTSFESMAAFSTETSANLVGEGDPIRLTGTSVTADLFRVLGARPIIGRPFQAEDEREESDGAVILSYALWQGVFGGDRDMIGRVTRLDDRPTTIVGVMPADFSFPSREDDFWVPLRLGGQAGADRTDNSLEAIARLKPGVSLEQAQTELTLVAQQLERAYPKENEKTGATVVALRDAVSGQMRLLLTALFGASICVLLIACTNLASLLLTRFLSRRHELTVRAAMGAGRERLVRQLLTESLVLALAGGALGVLVAFLAVPLFGALVPRTLPIGDPSVLDLRVLAFASLLTAVTGIGFGVMPAMRVCRGADAAALRERSAPGAGHRGERLRAALVLAEVTASIVLLVASGLLVRALWRVQSVAPGFETDNVLTLHTPLPIPKYGKADTRIRFYERVLSEVRALPGVSNAAYISFLPMVVRAGIWPVSVKGSPEVQVRGADSASLRYVTPDFFGTLGIPIRRGRDIAESDTPAAPLAAVVSESLVRKYWPDQDPLGRTFMFAFAERTVVGVVGDIRVRGLERESEPQVYLSYRQMPGGAIIGYVPRDLVIKTSGDPLTLMPSLRQIVKQADPELPVSDVRTLADIVAADIAPRRTQVRVLSAFVAIALMLASVGIHGLLSFGVSRRRSEIGLRVALGAQRSDVLRMILRQGVVLAAIGSAIGMGLAHAAGRAMQAVLAGVPPTDLVTFGAAAALAIVMTVLGSLVPAFRALRVDPATALRAE